MDRISNLTGDEVGPFDMTSDVFGSIAAVEAITEVDTSDLRLRAVDSKAIVVTTFVIDSEDIL